MMWSSTFELSVNAVLFFVLLLAIAIALWYFRYFRFYRYLKSFPRANHWPLFGTALEFPSTAALYSRLLELRGELGINYWMFLGFQAYFVSCDPKFLKILLSSSKFIDKGTSYRYLHKWLGLGLLTSTGERWKTHRKMLTPAFHFKILEESAETFNGASDVLVRKLSEELGKPATDVYPYVTLCALDVICESAMGLSVNAQMNSNSKYVQSVKEMSRIPVDRTTRLIESFDLTYFLTRNYWREQQILKYLHDFTDSVIRRRRATFVSSESADKKKVAFLDLLLRDSARGGEFSDQDIREEVDTFMFEGHDTTSSAISFALYALANNPTEQENAFAEIKSIFDDDKDRVANYKDFQEMKYLELVIKEAMRLYPPVPLFERNLTEDLEYDGRILPKGLSVMILPFVLHRDPDIFPNPDVFNPERFLSGHTSEINAYNYIPFSAGPRNCIGQKFAMLAMKSTISKVLRNFELLPVRADLELTIEAILKSRNGVLLKLKERRW